MIKQQPSLDAIFGALSDPIRRQIVVRLASGQATAGELASAFPVSQPAVSRHLKVLEQSGLMKRTVVGRVHHFRLMPRAMRTASQWIREQERFWHETFDSLESFLASESAAAK